MSPIKLGDFFNNITKNRADSKELSDCIIETVQKLNENDTDINRPGMLLGKIQSGKTRAFIGVIALAFDNDYDIAIILTKGTKALAQQTYERLKKDFSEFVYDDKVQIFDIMHVPENLTPYELRQKIIMVVKKETNNLKRIIKALIETYPNLGSKKLLIIDDEADYASVGFKKDKEDGSLQMNKIPKQIDELRSKVSVSDFLQVTATPYSLYLQPENIEIKNEVFEPIRPSFNVLLPIYKGYVGGDAYFKNSEDDITSLNHFIYEEVPSEELSILKKEDKRSFKLSDALESKRVDVLRKAVLNFIVGACIRKLQQRHEGQKEKKYSFIIHTEQARKSHSWQEQIATSILTSLQESINNNQKLFNELIKSAYDDLIKSVNLTSSYKPDFSELFKEVSDALTNGCLMITKVNSEKQAEELLDEAGQLRLRTPLNIFIGGQILDRGITIENLIGFYYGRKPNKFQQDTVLQHSRMFGNRTVEDLSVTRFYTDILIYESMKKINEFDNALREAFENDAHDNGVVFICRDDNNKILPCSPNKILLSTTTTLKPNKRILPVGFQTDYKTNIKKYLEEIDNLIEKLTENNSQNPVIIDVDIAEKILDLIFKMFKFENGYDWDINAFKVSLNYLSKNSPVDSLKGKVYLITRLNRSISRKKVSGSYSNTPDNPETDQVEAIKYAQDIPVLTLLRQNGLENEGWMGSPFWWPVLLVPKNMKTVIFASDLIDVDQT